MKRLLNTLYVSTQGAYIRKEGQSVSVQVEKETKLRVPLHNLSGIVCFGNVLCSPFLLGACAEHDVAVSFLTANGRFLAAVRGRVNGNVLLRREQYRRADDEEYTLSVIKSVLTGKIANARSTLRRAMRDGSGDREALDRAVIRLKHYLGRLGKEEDGDTLRGIEGEAARSYFGVFNHLVTRQKEHFQFTKRSRRPPLDRINALMSFVYTILLHDVTGALEAHGLDPCVGFLHRDRPGRFGLALDLMEEFRSCLADRLVLSLINRQQIRERDFEVNESGAIWLKESSRKVLLTAYQKRKHSEIRHPFLGETMPVGLLFHAQALLFARYLRGDLDAYPVFYWK